MRGISRLAQKWLASQEGLCFTELVGRVEGYVSTTKRLAVQCLGCLGLTLGGAIRGFELKLSEVV